LENKIDMVRYKEAERAGAIDLAALMVVKEWDKGSETEYNK
jgi:hypothetical protein